MKKRKTLDILMPTYNYKFGLLKNIETLAKCKNKNNFNIIISDDSEISLLKNEEIRYWNIKFNNNFEYIRNSSKTAIHNWNSLIKYSKAKYFILLHQDEHFESIHQVDDLIHLLNKSKKDIIYITRHNSLRKFLGNKVNTLMPYKITKKIIDVYPKLLFYINLIGPPSCLIIPSNDLQYDTKLKLLVDVEYYFRILKIFNFKYCEVNTYTSTSGTSITDSLSKNFKKIIKYERVYLKESKILHKLDFLKLEIILPFVLSLKYISIILRIFFIYKPFK